MILSKFIHDTLHFSVYYVDMIEESASTNPETGDTLTLAPYILQSKIKFCKHASILLMGCFNIQWNILASALG